MAHKVEKLAGNKVKISFNIPADSFEEALGKAYSKMRGSINVPGFRKGKAPRMLIERMYGPAVFYDEALEIIFPDAYMEAVNAEELHPVSRPEVDVQSMEKGKDLEFSCEVYVQPEVKLGEYKGLEVERLNVKAGDAEIDARIAQDQKKQARILDVTDRAIENGDTVNLDYSGSVDGVKFDGGTAQGQTLVIGSGNFIPGFEEQMVGMSIGEEKNIQVKFPDEYHAEELKGKDAVFHVKANSATHEELPALDDEFASEISDFETFADYRKDVAEKLQKDHDEHSTEAAKQALVAKVVENAEIDLPDPMVETKLDDMMEQMSWRMQQQGFTLQKYLELTGGTEAQMRDMYREEAANNVKTELVLDEIIKQEKTEADPSDIDGMLGEYASAMNQTIDQLKETLGESQKEYFEHRSKLNKVLDMIWDSAKVKDVDEKADKAAESADKPAKKTAKKAAPADDEAAEKPAKKAAAKKSGAAKTDEADASDEPKEKKAKAASVKEKGEAAKTAAKAKKADEAADAKA